MRSLSAIPVAWVHVVVLLAMLALPTRAATPPCDVENVVMPQAVALLNSLGVPTPVDSAGNAPKFQAFTGMSIDKPGHEAETVDGPSEGFPESIIQLNVEAFQDRFGEYAVCDKLVVAAVLYHEFLHLGPPAPAPPPLGPGFCDEWKAAQMTYTFICEKLIPEAIPHQAWIDLCAELCRLADEFEEDQQRYIEKGCTGSSGVPPAHCIHCGSAWPC